LGLVLLIFFVLSRLGSGCHCLLVLCDIECCFIFGIKISLSVCISL
jgi:hypothetical protein